MALPTSAVPSIHSASHSPPLSTATSLSSYSMPSKQSPTNSSASLRFTEADSDDEIIWAVSEPSRSSASSETDDASTSDEDFVVLKRPSSAAPRFRGTDNDSEVSTSSEDNAGVNSHTPITSSIALETAMKGLILVTPESSPRKAEQRGKMDRAVQQLAAGASAEGKKKKRKAKKKKAAAARTAAEAYPSPAPSPKAHKASRDVIQVNGAGTREWFEEMSKVKYVGLGARPIVDDYSDRQSVISYDESIQDGPTIYEEASTFISRFLSNPDAKSDNICRLTLLQSLIIELGLATPSLPESLTAAKAFLKSRAFVNIKEYLAVREQGPEAVRGLLYPSKSALIKDIRKKGNRASLQWVKEHGLQVLLVGWAR